MEMEKHDDHQAHNLSVSGSLYIRKDRTGESQERAEGTIQLQIFYLCFT